jgi:hypothetical protein
LTWNFHRQDIDAIPKEPGLHLSREWKRVKRLNPLGGNFEQSTPAREVEPFLDGNICISIYHSSRKRDLILTCTQAVEKQRKDEPWESNFIS